MSGSPDHARRIARARQLAEQAGLGGVVTDGSCEPLDTFTRDLLVV